MTTSAGSSRFLMQMVLFLLAWSPVLPVSSGCVSSKCADPEPPSPKLWSRPMDLLLWKAITVEVTEECEDKCLEQIDLYGPAMLTRPSLLPSHCNLGRTSLSLRVPVSAMSLTIDKQPFKEYWNTARGAEKSAEGSQKLAQIEGQCESYVQRALSSFIPTGLNALRSSAHGSTSTAPTPVGTISGYIANVVMATFQKQCVVDKSKIRPTRQRVCKCVVGIRVQNLLIPRPDFLEDDHICDPETFAKHFEFDGWIIEMKDGKAVSVGEPVEYNPNRAQMTKKRLARFMRPTDISWGATFAAV